MFAPPQLMIEMGDGRYLDVHFLVQLGQARPPQAADTMKYKISCGEMDTKAWGISNKCLIHNKAMILGEPQIDLFW